MVGVSQSARQVGGARAAGAEQAAEQAAEQRQQALPPDHRRLVAAQPPPLESGRAARALAHVADVLEVLVGAYALPS